MRKDLEDTQNQENFKYSQRTQSQSIRACEREKIIQYQFLVGEMFTNFKIKFVYFHLKQVTRLCFLQKY